MVEAFGWLAPFVDAATVSALDVGVGVVHLDDALLFEVEYNKASLHRLEAGFAGRLVYYAEGRKVVRATLLVGIVDGGLYLVVVGVAVMLVEHGQTVEHIVFDIAVITHCHGKQFFKGTWGFAARGNQCLECIAGRDKASRAFVIDNGETHYIHGNDDSPDCKDGRRSAEEPHQNRTKVQFYTFNCTILGVVGRVRCGVMHTAKGGAQ